MATGLPIAITGTNTWQTAVSLQNFNVEIPEDDRERIELVQDYVAGHIDKHWIESLRQVHPLPSPEPAGLPLSADRAGPSGQQARRAAGREEPRTIKAAAICAERGYRPSGAAGQPGRDPPRR